MIKITSAQNPQIKQAAKLLKPAERKKSGQFLIEGEREISFALAGGIKLISLFFCPELVKNKKLLPQVNQGAIIEVSRKVFAKLSIRENSDGYLALAEVRQRELASVKLSANPLVIIVEAVEKPGNLGAILRSADAAGVDAVIIDDSKTDIYNPNVIRVSQGTVFTKQIAVSGFKEILAWLKENKIKIFAATPEAAKVYSQVNFRSPSAIALGAEDIGLSQAWLKAADEKIKILMQGRIDSLNVSVSAAVIIFEALRQREATSD